MCNRQLIDRATLYGISQSNHIALRYAIAMRYAIALRYVIALRYAIALRFSIALRAALLLQIEQLRVTTIRICDIIVTFIKISLRHSLGQRAKNEDTTSLRSVTEASYQRQLLSPSVPSPLAS